MSLLSTSLYDPPTALMQAQGTAATPAANTAAVKAIAPSTQLVGVAIGGICWSYSGAPTGGNVQVADGSTVIFNLDIAAGGPGFVPFRVPLRGSPGNTLTITLAAGGAAVLGKVNALGNWEI